MFLSQDLIPYHPLQVDGQASWFCCIKDSDTLFNLTDDNGYRFFKKSFELFTQRNGVPGLR